MTCGSRSVEVSINVWSVNRRTRVDKVRLEGRPANVISTLRGASLKNNSGSVPAPGNFLSWQRTRADTTRVATQVLISVDEELHHR